MYGKFNSSSRHICWLYLFLGGLLAGTLATNFWQQFFIEDMGLLNAASVSRLKYLDIDKNAFFIYVLRERMSVMLILGLFATTYAGIVAVSIYTAWAGTMAGIFLSIASIRYGIKGIFLVAAGIMPQCILLVPAGILLLNWCYQFCAELYYPNKNYQGRTVSGKQYFLKKVLQFLIICGVVIIGSIAESYVNPILLSSFLKLF